MPAAWADIERLPGSYRQRSNGSRRLRVDRCRIVCIVDDSVATVDVLAIHRRRPYDYGDLDLLLKNLS
jgi:hypothetical protein